MLVNLMQSATQTGNFGALNGMQQLASKWDRCQRVPIDLLTSCPRTPRTRENYPTSCSTLFLSVSGSRRACRRVLMKWVITSGGARLFWIFASLWNVYRYIHSNEVSSSESIFAYHIKRHQSSLAGFFACVFFPLFFSRFFFLSLVYDISLSFILYCQGKNWCRVPGGYGGKC